jgi:hypothetical protein
VVNGCAKHLAGRTDFTGRPLTLILGQRYSVGPVVRFELRDMGPKGGADKGPMPPVGQLCLFGLAPAAFTGKVFTNATASSSHALSASFVGTGGSI